MESLFLLKNKVNIYDGGILQPSPWILTVFYLLEGLFTNWWSIRILFLSVDILICAALHKIAQFADSPLTPNEVVKCWMYNPLNTFSVFGMNCGIFTVLLQLTALLSALKDKMISSVLMTGFLVHFDFYNLALVAPMTFCFKTSGRRSKFILKFLSVWIILTLSSNWILSHVWNVKRVSLLSIIDSVYISRMRIDSLRPNSGLSWYLFSQVFPAFTPLLKMTFQLTLMVFWPACAIKFRKDPIFMFTALIGTLAILKGYPSVSDYGLFFGLLMTQARVFEQCRVLIIALFVAGGVFVIKMQVWRYWIELPGFNVNFYYIFTLVWNAILVIIYLDVVAAYNKSEIYRNNSKIEKGEGYENCKLFQR